MKNNQTGFTLIEVMVVVAIVGILAAIAYPNYTEYVRKGNRTAAKAALMDSAQALERYYSVNGTYLDGGALATVYPSTVHSGGEPFYEVAVGAATNDTYTLNATGKGMMASDDCGVYSVSHTGVLASSSTDSKCL